MFQNQNVNLVFYLLNSHILPAHNNSDGIVQHALTKHQCIQINIDM